MILSKDKKTITTADNTRPIAMATAVRKIIELVLQRLMGTKVWD